MKQKIIISIGVLFVLISCKENYIDIDSIPRPDCSGETSIWHEFFKDPVKILVIPDFPSDTSEFNLMVSFKKGHYPDSLIRRESELRPEDFTSALEIYGNINEFNVWERFDLPIKSLDYGYEFKNQKYQNDLDGMFYISENRLVFTGNSMKIIWVLQTTVAPFYKFILFEDGLLSQYCLPDGTIIDIDKVRKSNFHKKSTKYFNLFVDKKFPKTTSISDSVVIDICERIQIPLPDYSINAFLHDGANSTRLFSNFFLMAGCDTLEKDLLINTVHMNGIHVNGLDLETIKHEVFHLLWNTSVGSPGEQSFLSEGIVEHYMQLRDSTRIKRNFEVLHRHTNHDIGNLILRGNAEDFWGGPSENNWPIAYNISGLFVKYLVDNWGLDTFKRFYPITDRERAYNEIYALTPDKIEEEFYNWIEKYSAP